MSPFIVTLLYGDASFGRAGDDDDDDDDGDDDGDDDEMSVSLVEETGIPGGNHRTSASD